MPALTFSGDMASTGASTGSSAPTPSPIATASTPCSAARSSAAPRTRRASPARSSSPTNQEELDVALAGILPSAKSENAKTYMADGTPVTASETLGADRPRARRPSRRRLLDDPLLLDGRPGRHHSSTRAGRSSTTTPSRRRTRASPVAWRASARSRGRRSRPRDRRSSPGSRPTGRLLAQAGRRPVVYSTPLVAWRPVVGATAYEVQWSRSKYPWRARGSSFTFATSTVLQLGRRRWYYRVRGLNAAQVGTPAMTWSAPVAVKVVRPTFRISGG